MTEERRKRIVVKIIGKTPAGIQRPLPLDEREWTISELVERRVPSEWEHVFSESRNEFLKVDLLIGNQKKLGKRIFPYTPDTFRAFVECPLSKTKVVVFGQDPYYDLNGLGRPKANGMSFATSRGSEVPRSAQNIYKMIKKSYPNFVVPDHADFTKWAQQGVLFLNASLTVNANEPNSHQGWWDGFIRRVLNELNKLDRKVIYLLWGADAQKQEGNIPYEHAIIMTAPHPVARNMRDDDPKSFVSCGHFAKVNDLLRSWGEKEIDWNLDE